MSRTGYSLRWRIVALVSVLVLLLGLVIGALALVGSWHEIEEVYDAQLIHAAKVLRQLTAHELAEHENGAVDLIPDTPDLGYKYEQNIAFRIWRDGEPVTRSTNAIAFGDLHAPPGLSDQSINGDKWRFFVYVDTNSAITVETAEKYAIRYELVGYLLLGLLIPASAFVPAVLLAVWFGTSRGLRPLANLSGNVDRRDINDLSSIEAEHVPREIDSLVRALNRLFKRLDEALVRERDFTDNAAHELRTPLAAIKTQAQALRARIGDAPQCRESLANLAASIDRATNLVDKLLAFSRLQKEALRREPVSLAPLLAIIVEEARSNAAARGQSLILDAETDVVVEGDIDALAMMVRNLVDNAIKYTPDAGTIRVTLRSDGTGRSIEVRDNGPGISDENKERVLERFYRVAGADNPGSGLGLAIARWIAECHRATLSLSDAKPSGLACTIRFQGT